LDLKLLEDLLALASTRSFVRAAELRHVTHPAFGRRIRALEAWAGVPLVEGKRSPLAFTPAGEALLVQAAALVSGLAQTRKEMLARQPHSGDRAAPLRIGTGRTLARTLVADWIARLRAPLRGQHIEIVTRAMSDIAAMFERGETDLLCCYEHPALSIKLSAQRFRFITLAHDRLVPVTRADAQGHARHALEGTPPLLGYAPSLALGRLLRDHLERSPRAALPPATMVCDSADAIHELVCKGLGVAWLPRSLVAADIRRRLLLPLGGRSDEVHFEVRLYRPRARQSALVEAVWAATDR
jgi:LysR family transcriptional regulator, hypochlorite-specific transcription factor HypT